MDTCSPPVYGPVIELVAGAKWLETRVLTYGILYDNIVALNYVSGVQSKALAGFARG